MFESMFSFIAGLKVVLPSSPHDAKGLIKRPIRDNNPVILFEHQKLSDETGPVPAEDYVIPLGKAGIKRPGKDVTLVTYAYMVGKSLAAAEQLAREGIDVEVVDLRTVDPIDEEAIVALIEVEVGGFGVRLGAAEGEDEGRIEPAPEIVVAVRVTSHIHIHR